MLSSVVTVPVPAAFRVITSISALKFTAWLSRMGSGTVPQQSSSSRNPNAAGQLDHASSSLAEHQILDGDDMNAFQPLQVAPALTDPKAQRATPQSGLCQGQQI